MTAVSQGFFSAFELAPEAGRWTLADDHHAGAAAVAVVSDAFFRQIDPRMPLTTTPLATVFRRSLGARRFILLLACAIPAS